MVYFLKLTRSSIFDKSSDMLSYKFLIYFAVFLLIFTFSFVTSASTVIFSDGFESDFSNWTGNDPKWDTSGGNVHGGAKRGEVKGNTEPGDDVLLKNVSTFSYDGVALEFWYRIKESLEDDDHVYVEWTGDGSNWNILKDFTLITKSDTWIFASYPIPAEAGDKSNFAIRFRAYLGAVTSDIFYLDDVVLLAGSTTNEPTPVTIPQATPTPESTPDSIPAPTLTSTSSPQVTLAPPTPTPTLISTPALTPTSSPKPFLSPQVTPTPIFTPSTAVSQPPQGSGGQAGSPPPVGGSSPSTTPVVISSPKPNQESYNANKDLTVASQSLEADSNFSASISTLFNNSKFFWLISAIVLMVVLSLSKLKNN